MSLHWSKLIQEVEAAYAGEKMAAPGFTDDLTRVSCDDCLRAARRMANLTDDAPIEAVIDKLMEEGKL